MRKMLLDIGYQGMSTNGKMIKYVLMTAGADCQVLSKKNHVFQVLKFKTQRNAGPGQVAQLIRALSWYAKVAGSIPGQGTFKNQPMSE